MIPDDINRSNMDFKTRLTLPEISAHACLEFLNEVVKDKDKFGTELRIIHLIDRMKRLRVSEEGKGREAIENIFKGVEKEDAAGMIRRLFAPRNPNLP